MMEFLNTLTWPAAFAVVGSIVTIITGIFGYLIQSKKTGNGKPSSLAPISNTDNRQDQLLDSANNEIATLKERLAYVDGDVRELRGYIKSLQKQLTDHEQRDIRDFRNVQEKIDKLTEIIIQLLQQE